MLAARSQVRYTSGACLVLFGFHQVHVVEMGFEYLPRLLSSEPGAPSTATAVVVGIGHHFVARPACPRRARLLLHTASSLLHTGLEYNVIERLFDGRVS